MKKGFILGVAGLSFLAPGAIATPPPTGPLRITVPFQGSLAIAVLDSRPDVVSGERQETFIGLSRSLYGIPYPAHTPSKKPFATELVNLAARALKLGGTPPQVVTVSPYHGRQRAIEAMKATSTDRLLLIELRDWWSDTLIHTDLHYDLGLTVFNAEGQELGSTSLIGHDSVGKRERPERRDLPTATNDILGSLFAAKPIVDAFSATATPVATPSPTCTVDQILKMKDAGLTQEQIEAACGTSATKPPQL
jgi:hypothetical protein